MTDIFKYTEELTGDNYPVCVRWGYLIADRPTADEEDGTGRHKSEQAFALIIQALREVEIVDIEKC